MINKLSMSFIILESIICIQLGSFFSSDDNFKLLKNSFTGIAWHTKKDTYVKAIEWGLDWATSSPMHELGLDVWLLFALVYSLFLNP